LKTYCEGREDFVRTTSAEYFVPCASPVTEPASDVSSGSVQVNCSGSVLPAAFVCDTSTR
jgi:hypothetical protein